MEAGKMEKKRGSKWSVVAAAIQAARREKLGAKVGKVWSVIRHGVRAQRAPGACACPSPIRRQMTPNDGQEQRWTIRSRLLPLGVPGGFATWRPSSKHITSRERGRTAQALIVPATVWLRLRGVEGASDDAIFHCLGTPPTETEGVVDLPFLLCRDAWRQ